MKFRYVTWSRLTMCTRREVGEGALTVAVTFGVAAARALAIHTVETIRQATIVT
jgi:hypothetical protein